VRLAIWSTTTPRENSAHPEMFRRQLEEVELAERIGIDQIWFFEHHLQPTAPVPSPNLLNDNTEPVLSLAVDEPQGRKLAAEPDDAATFVRQPLPSCPGAQQTVLST